jgi:hypothetical protein
VFLDDVVPAIDNAIYKDQTIRIPNWKTVFSANDMSFVLPILQQAVNLLASATYQPTVAQVKTAMCQAYSQVFRETVTRGFLSTFGFNSIDEFRNSGASQLDRQFFWSLARRIDRFDIGVQFLVYGFDYTDHRAPHMLRLIIQA